MGKQENPKNHGFQNVSKVGSAHPGAPIPSGIDATDRYKKVVGNRFLIFCSVFAQFGLKVYRIQEILLLFAGFGSRPARSRGNPK